MVPPNPIPIYSFTVMLHCKAGGLVVDVDITTILQYHCAHTTDSLMTCYLSTHCRISMARALVCLIGTPSCGSLLMPAVVVSVEESPAESVHASVRPIKTISIGTTSDTIQRRSRSGWRLRLCFSRCGMSSDRSRS